MYSTLLKRRLQIGRRPILILGHGRSGTTWVGSIISAARRVLYYAEPMHPDNGGAAELKNWYRYARPGESNDALATAFDPVFAGLPSPAKAWNRSAWHRWLPGYRVAVKDVAAFMSAEWLYKRYRPQMLFIVRHPCAVILSELRQGTPAIESLNLIMRNDPLVKDHLLDFLSVLRDSKGEIEALAAVWAVRHKVLAEGLKVYPEWRVVCYEALCADPGTSFRCLFKSLDLQWSQAMAEFVDEQSSVHVAGEYSGRRISSQQIDKWKSEINQADINRVRRIVQSFNIPFYRDKDEWSLERFHKMIPASRPYQS